MPLTKEELDGLMRLVGLTRESEINCDRCLTQVAEFADLELAGKSVPDGLEAVDHHLSICGECQEEYEALRRALRDMSD